MPSIGYENILESATITVTTEDADYPKENAYDWLMFPGDVWKPTATGTSTMYVDAGSVVSADYFGAYNIDADQIYLRATDASWVTTSTPFQNTSLSGNQVVYGEFTQVSSRYWRIDLFKSGLIPALGVVAFGDKLTIPESVQVGFAPANLAGGGEYLNNGSDGGYFLGRSLIRNGEDMDMSFDLLTPSFIRSSWDAFILHAEQKPFFFAWDYTNYSDEAAICWTDGKIRKPNYSRPNFMRANLKVKARV